MATTIDEALDIIHRTGPDLVGGNSNHSPMVSEALLAMDRPDSVMPWIEGYQNRFQERLHPAPLFPPEAGMRHLVIEAGAPIGSPSSTTSWRRGRGRPCCGDGRHAWHRG